MQEAAKIKNATPTTLMVAIHQGRINREIKWEKRNGYERKIIYIVDDEKFQAYKLKNRKLGESGGYYKKCEVYHYEPDNIISKHIFGGEEELNRSSDRVTHARYLPLDI